MRVAPNQNATPSQIASTRAGARRRDARRPSRSRSRRIAIVTLVISVGFVAARTPGPSRVSAATLASVSVSVAASDPLGAIPVDGAADEAPPPKLALVPIVTTTDADSMVQIVVRRDLELTGEYDVVPEEQAPPGPFFRDAAIEVAPWRAKGVEVVVRVRADVDASSKVTLVAEIVATDGAGAKVLERRVDASGVTPRFAAHRLADAIVGALTGRPSSFASRLAFVGPVGRARRLYLADADGFDLRLVGPDLDVIVSPTFGPSGALFYGVSHDDAPFTIAHGPSATPLTTGLVGSVLGLSFAPSVADPTGVAAADVLAITVMRDGASALSLGHADGSALHVIKTPKLVGRPVFGPNGHVAYSAGDRVYVDGVAVSPAGSHASSPTFCDGPRGLLVVFAAGPSTSTDLFVTDTVGGAYRRLTAGAGANGAPACSADGRLVAFFSTRTIGLGAGLYVTPLDHASRVHRLGPELGDSLEWEPLPEARR